MLYFLSISLIILMLVSIPVAVVLYLLGVGVAEFFSPFPLIRALGQNWWSSSESFLLIAIPLFILMGEIIVRSGIANKAYIAMDRWLSWLPGGLLHSNIATSALFSATSGSSVATAATISTVAMPQAKALGYDAKLFTGTIAAGGTLGILIPPSINLIVYGFLTQTSIPRLFMAGLIPGLLLAILFMACSAILCKINPKLGGPSQHYSWKEKFSTLIYLLPLLVLFLIIIGTIYAGWATPTEAAAVGVVIALVLALCVGKLNFKILNAALLGTIVTTSMILFIILAASYLNFTLASAGIIPKLNNLITTYAVGKYSLLFIVIAMLFFLGFFIETLSLMVITIPIITPLLFAVGFDHVWFGIIMIVFIEMALITPPVGLNLYIVQSARPGQPFKDVMIGIIPYILCMCVLTALLITFPQIAVWLPNMLFN